MFKSLDAPSSSTDSSRHKSNKCHSSHEANLLYRRTIKKREGAMQRVPSSRHSCILEVELAFQSRPLLSRLIEKPQLYLFHHKGPFSRQRDLPAVLEPLEECIMNIQWEISNCSLAREIVRTLGREKVFLSLRSAALYQATLETVRFVHQLNSRKSLIRDGRIS